jgi:Tfp pilus assembly protein PilF
MDIAARKEVENASALMERGQLVRARELVTDLKARHESTAAVWALASEISLRQGNLVDALEEVTRAINLDPSNPRRHAQRARCAILAGRRADARTSVDLALRHGVQQVDDLLLIASVLVRCDDHECALRLYERAEQLQPQRNEIQRGLATVHRFLGQVDRAERSCDRAIAIDPHDYEMLNLRSTLRRQRPDSNHVKELEHALRNARNWRGAVQIAYALAKELEDLGDHARSFRYLTQGASLRRRHTRYDVQDDVRIFSAIQAAFSAEAIRQQAATGYVTDEPIFVLGLPRTGSTLVERIISSHRSVTSAGELNTFAIEMLELVSARNGGVQPERLLLPAAALQVNMLELGRNYVEAARPRAQGAIRFIDKLPLNSLYLGLIHLALPKARVVHVQRHPVDTCLAIFKYLFKNAYPFSYDLSDLATYYIEHHRLMEHWRAVLPSGWLYEIRYEDVVMDQQSATRRLLEYLDLPWDDACLDYHRNDRAATTGSATQVREPLYASSVGKWRCYEKELQPLITRLRDAGIVFE